MQFELHLLEPKPSAFAARTYDPDQDDVRSILVDVCRAIGSRGQFIISGFGDNRWPVDVCTDLPIFLEQLPSVLRAFNEGAAIDIDFYEQGVERSISFEAIGDQYLAKCTSRTDWQPCPATEEIDRHELEEMFLTAREEFMRALRGMSSELARHPWIQRWLRGLP